MPDAPPHDLTETQVFEINRHEAERLDQWINAVGRRWGESNQIIFDARLCLGELFANVIEHAIARTDRDRITVTLVRRPDGIGIEFVDTCARFDPTSVAAPVQGQSIESASVGGRGLVLVRAYAKELAHRYDGGGNRITLRIAARSASK